MKKVKLKILLIGPSRCGKSCIANVLSECGVKWDPEGEYKLESTKGVRILEFDLTDIKIQNENVLAEIELWDCGGDDINRNCWPAFRLSADGIIFVYDNKFNENTNKKLEILFNYYVSQKNLSPRQCLLIQNQITQDDRLTGLIKLSSTFAQLSQITVNLNSGITKLKNDFRTYITALLNYK